MKRQAPVKGLIFACVGLAMGLLYLYLRLKNQFPFYRPALESFWFLIVFWGLFIWFLNRKKTPTR